VRFFGVIWIGIGDPGSLGSWCIEGTNESTLVTDSSVPLMSYDPGDLGSLILIQITPKECTHGNIKEDSFQVSLCYYRAKKCAVQSSGTSRFSCWGRIFSFSLAQWVRDQASCLPTKQRTN